MQFQPTEPTVEAPQRQSNEKAELRKLTVLLSPDAYERLIRESTRRKIAGEANRQISAMLREAVNKYFSGK
jgi:hypothetical protein